MASDERRSSRNLRLVAAAIIGLALVILISTLRDKPRVSTAEDKSAATELVTVLAQGQRATFHGRFSTTSPEGNGTLEMWRSGANFRQKVESAGQGGEVDLTDLVVSESDVVSCAKVGARPWDCTSVPQLRDQVQQAISDPTAKLNGERVSQRRTRIGDQQTRCFTVDVPESEEGGGLSEVCLTNDGIPVRLSSEGSVTELVSLSREVGPEDFVPPPAPTPSPSAPAPG